MFVQKGPGLIGLTMMMESGVSEARMTYYFQVGVVVEGGEAVTKGSCHLVREVVGGCIGGGVRRKGRVG